jgi:anti-anti-sigma factor
MPNQPFQAKVRTVGNAAIIDMEGEIDAFADGSMNEVYAQAAGPGIKNVLLNFSQVHYINSTGIALIVRLLSQARKAGISVLTYGLSSHYVEIFQITRLADFMTIYPDEKAALAGLVPA